MLRVIIELWPYGNEKHKRTLATANIFNDASGTMDSGNYRANMFHHHKTTGRQKMWSTSRVKDFPRKRLDAFELLRRVLNSAVDNKGKPR